MKQAIFAALPAIAVFFFNGCHRSPQLFDVAQPDRRPALQNVSAGDIDGDVAIAKEYPRLIVTFHRLNPELFFATDLLKLTIGANGTLRDVFGRFVSTSTVKTFNGPFACGIAFESEAAENVVALRATLHCLDTIATEEGQVTVRVFSWREEIRRELVRELIRK